MIKRTLWLFTGVVTLGLAVSVGMAWSASSRILCPPRKHLQSYHRETLQNPGHFELKIQAFEASGHPCLICEPNTAHKPSTKGSLLRQQLAAEMVPLGTWGEVLGTAVLLHGHSGCKEDHLPIAERLCAAGFRCLLVDLPGHGQSPIQFATFGHKEASLPREVLLGAVQKFGFSPTPAVLFGVSQGGAIALQAARPEPAAWAAVAEVSAFASLDRVIKHKSTGWFGPLGSTFAAAIEQIVYHRAGFHPAQIRPLDAAGELHVPVLIGHGEDDTLVTLEQAEEIFRAIPDPRKDFLLINEAGHSNVFTTSAPIYKTVAKFLLDAIRRPSTTK